MLYNVRHHQTEAIKMSRSKQDTTHKLSTRESNNGIVITKPKAESGNYQRERPMLHMLKLKSPENAR